MAHFALLDENNVVQNVVVVDNSELLDEKGVEQEIKGIQFCTRVIGAGRWLQTSRNTSRGVHRDPDTQLPDGGTPFRGNFAQIGYIYIEDLNVFMPPKPEPWLVPTAWGTWVAPFPLNIHTGEPFSHGELEYIFFYMRHTKEFRICPAVPFDAGDEFNAIACTTTSDYMYPTFEENMYGYNRFREVSEAFIEGEKISIPHIHFLKKEIDMTPIVLFVHAGWEELNIDVASDALNCHPQTGARTIHELFRLIIEWAYAHTEFGNNEPAAVKCHQILCELQMPLDVRNELLMDVEAQAVERYVRGLEPFIATSYAVVSDPPMPPRFEEWYSEVRKKYKPEYVGVPVPVDLASLPSTYPM